MFAQAPLINHAHDDKAAHTYHAHDLFAQLYGQARLHALGAVLRARPAKLTPLARVLQNRTVVSRRYAGVSLVALDAIRGSENRSADFDASFRPRRRHMAQRWIRVAAAWMAGVVFAPVELIQVDDDYFVRDGHHRISVARAFGQHAIEAEITVWEVSNAPARAAHRSSPGRAAMPCPA